MECEAFRSRLGFLMVSAGFAICSLGLKNGVELHKGLRIYCSYVLPLFVAVIIVCGLATCF